MNTSDNNPNKHEPVDQVDDLTRFLDEDFDTDEVDLFEFTTEEDSPLTQLKSVVLSLDWEITDETLADLADEINHLREQELFQADKVSQVYLQGLNKIGQYIQSEGAYAHKNAIKLLLTLFYDFEKILSSETITGSEITTLLKADVRKFKILQYQIAQKHGAEAEFTEESGPDLILTDSEALQGIQSVILELDWEVTDEGLQHMTDQLENLKKKFADNKYIQVLVQGLFSLKTYIYEERAKAHPEAFSLLHTFCRGLEALIENEDLSDEERQTIVVDKINRLNNLKNLIADVAAKRVQDLDEDAIEPIAKTVEDKFFDEDLDIETEGLGATPVTEEKIAGETAAAAPAETIGFDEDEEPGLLAAEDTGEEPEVAPALAESPDEEGLDLDEAPPEELEEKLESFFGEDKKTPEPQAEEEAVAEAPEAEEELEAMFEGEEEEPEIAPALAESPVEEGLNLDEAPPEELEEKLEFFFGTDEESPALEAGKDTLAETVEHDIEPAEEIQEVADFGDEEEVIDVVPALAGSPEDAGYTAGEDELVEGPPEELEDKLGFFFGEDEKTPEPEAEEEAVAEAPAEPPEAEKGLEAMFEGEEEPDIAPALAESPDEEGLDLDEAPSEELEDRLESFFGEDEKTPEPEAEEEAVGEAPEAEEKLEAMFEGEKEEPEIAPALAESPDEEGLDLDEAPPEELEERLESFFGEDEEAAVPQEEETITEESIDEVAVAMEEEPGAEEEVLLTPSIEEPALDEAIEEEVSIPEVIASGQEYQSAVEEMRTEFKDMEKAFRQEIESLREEIRSLRSEMPSK